MAYGDAGLFFRTVNSSGDGNIVWPHYSYELMDASSLKEHVQFKITSQGDILGWLFLFEFDRLFDLFREGIWN